MLVDFMMKAFYCSRVGCNSHKYMSVKKIKCMSWHRIAVTVINVTGFILSVNGTVQSIMSTTKVLRLVQGVLACGLGRTFWSKGADSLGFKMPKDIKT